MGAARRWASMLDAWAIPDDVLARAPEPPWGFPVGLFERHAQHALARPTRSHERALEALPEGGTVLDVGSGAGAASLPLARRAGRIVAIDDSRAMLDAFAARAGALGVAHDEVEGRWPDDAGRAPEVDVVVCAHLVYNVPAIEELTRALTRHARARVVVEMTETHPLTRTRALWRHFHGLERPAGPSVDDYVAVVRAAGIEPRVERWTGAPEWAGAPRSELVAFLRRRLCLPAARDAEIERLVDAGAYPLERRCATVWWDAARLAGRLDLD